MNRWGIPAGPRTTLVKPRLTHSHTPHGKGWRSRPGRTLVDSCSMTP
jgi:hypothetical protein